MIGQNLTVSSAVNLINEDQSKRIMVKHGWPFRTEHRWYVKIADGGKLEFFSTTGAENIVEPYVPSEGDYSALWDVYEIQ